MRRSSKYHSLAYIVEIKHAGEHSFETMCAFNVDQVAVNYAKSCSNHNREHEYRVLHRRSRDFLTIATFVGGLPRAVATPIAA